MSNAPYPNFNTRENQLKKYNFDSPVFLGGDRYTDYLKIKTRLRILFAKTNDGEHIAVPDQQFLLDIVKYHPKFDLICQDLAFFTTARMDTEEITRSIISVDTKGDVINCHIRQCLNQLVRENKFTKKHAEDDGKLVVILENEMENMDVN